ncbi:hypothetical protein [Methanococcoides sp.]|uniref:hypothetical protein n=1 Tax=Methanococcoides sp. TaxID=1966350 RepID=UPI00272E3656|nr:hypothetical protein [Methanococcoides sp.]
MSIRNNPIIRIQEMRQQGIQVSLRNNFTPSTSSVCVDSILRQQHMLIAPFTENL